MMTVRTSSLQMLKFWSFLAGFVSDLHHQEDQMLLFTNFKAITVKMIFVDFFLKHRIISESG